MHRDWGQTVNRERFEALVGAYGADLGRFPSDERSDAEAFLADSDEARALLERESHLDALLGAVSTPAPPQGLEARIVAAAPTSSAASSSPPATNVVPLRPRQRAAAGFFFAAAAAAGVWFGVQNSEELPSGSFDDPEQLAAAFDPLDWEEEDAP